MIYFVPYDTNSLRNSLDEVCSAESFLWFESARNSGRIPRESFFVSSPDESSGDFNLSGSYNLLKSKFLTIRILVDGSVLVSSTFSNMATVDAFLMVRILVSVLHYATWVI